MTVLLRQVAGVIRQWVASDDDYTHGIINARLHNHNYDYFIKVLENKIDFLKDLIYRLKQEQEYETNKS